MGIGVISINYTTNGEEDSIIKLFKNSKDKTPVKQFKILDVDEGLLVGENSVSIIPLEHMPTPGRLIFRCMDSTETMYKIVTDETVGNEYWVKKGVNKEYLDWLTYMQNCDYVSSDQPLRTLPDYKSTIVINVDSCFTYDILQMKGDWVEVMTNDYCDMYHENPTKHEISGWIRWREGKEIIVWRTYAE